jgi:hypothetical protein
VLIYELAEDAFLRSQFKVLPPSSPAYRQMTDAEYVLRFFMLSEKWRTFRGDLRVELDNFMATNRFADSALLSRLRRRFEVTIGAAEAIWGAHAFKRPGRDQAIAGLFDAQMIALAELDDADRKALVSKRSRIVRDADALVDDPEFDENVRRATNTPQRLRDRTTRMIATLEAAL